MFLRKIKLVMMAAAVVATLAAGAVALAHSGSGRPKDGAGKPQNAGSTGWTYHILASRNGETPRKVAVVEMTGDKPIRVNAPGAFILFEPKRDGQPDRRTASERHDQEHSGIVLTSPRVMDVDVTQRYIGRIHAHRHIDVRALDKGFVKEVTFKEGQSVKKGDLLFRIAPTLDRAKPDAELTNVIAPFDGIVGSLYEQFGSHVKEGDRLTTLSDNGVIWVYFDVPEKQYLEYMTNPKELEERPIELMLANQTRFPHPGRVGAILGSFATTTGSIAFRADFPNPDRLLRHGQSGFIQIQRNGHAAIVIPQRATYEELDRRYVYVVDKDDVAHQREIIVQNEMDDVFVIKQGVGVGDRIVLEGSPRVRDGEKVEYDFRPPEEVMRKPGNRDE